MNQNSEIKWCLNKYNEEASSKKKYDGNGINDKV